MQHNSNYSISVWRIEHSREQAIKKYIVYIVHRIILLCCSVWNLYYSVLSQLKSKICLWGGNNTHGCHCLKWQEPCHPSGQHSEIMRTTPLACGYGQAAWETFRRRQRREKRDGESLTPLRARTACHLPPTATFPHFSLLFVHWGDKATAMSAATTTTTTTRRRDKPVTTTVRLLLSISCPVTGGWAVF